jgi:hypothetical protein
VAVLAGLAGVQFVQLGLVATDQMCSIISRGGSQALSGKVSSLMVSSLLGGVPPFVAMLLSCLLIAGTMLVWLELVLREASVYLAAFFMPLALVGFIWPATATIAKRTVELLAALILSKFVIVSALTLGLAAVAGGTGTDDTVAGAAILLLSGFAPFALLRLAPVVETAAIAHLEGLSRRPAQVASKAAATASGARSHPAVKYLLDRAGTSGRTTESSVVKPATVTALPLRERSADYPVDGKGPSGG